MKDLTKDEYQRLIRMNQRVMSRLRKELKALYTTDDRKAEIRNALSQGFINHERLTRQKNACT